MISKLQDKLKLADGSEFTFSGKAFTPTLKALAGDNREAPPLAAVTEAYIALLDAWYKASAAGRLKDDRPPVLVLDEANVLMTWGDQYKAERQTLLRFFVAVSKVQCRSHVLLATSDCSFQAWLTQGEAAARMFSTPLLQQSPSSTLASIARAIGCLSV